MVKDFPQIWNSNRIFHFVFLCIILLCSILSIQQTCKVGEAENVWLAQVHPESFHGRVKILILVSLIQDGQLQLHYDSSFYIANGDMDKTHGNWVW